MNLLKMFLINCVYTVHNFSHIIKLCISCHYQLELRFSWAVTMKIMTCVIKITLCCKESAKTCIAWTNLFTFDSVIGGEYIYRRFFSTIHIKICAKFLSMYSHSLEKSFIWLHAIFWIVKYDKFQIYCIDFGIQMFFKVVSIIDR